MSKSKGNSFLPKELFAGSHPLLAKAYSPMAVRFFMLQSHYSSTLDFTNEALSAAEKGFKKLSNALSTVKSLQHTVPANEDATIVADFKRMISECYLTMSDDFNTAKTLAVLFEMSARINDFKSGNLKFAAVSQSIFEEFKNTYIAIMEDVLGIKDEESHNQELLDGVISVLIELRKKARTDKNFALSDRIRDELKTLGVQLMDGKDGEIGYLIE